MAEDVLAYQAAALLGSLAAVLFGTVAPYFKKFMETKEIVGEKLQFDKKFLVTGGIAFMFAMIAGIINFDATVSNIDYNATILKVFATSFLAGIGVNFGLNQYMKPSTTLVTTMRKLKAEGKLD